MTYLCYDLKGIQSFIFAVPRLKYICGGSAIIDRFDRDSVPKEVVNGAELLFSGGGKGAFSCTDDGAVQRQQARLIQLAHRDGLSISFGVHERYSEASHVTDRTFPWLPEASELEGHPCVESGMFPTTDETHAMIRRRVWQRGDHLSRRFEDQLLRGLVEAIPGLPHADFLEFFHDVTSREPAARRGRGALGKRNRWAIIAMDGNDMGSQYGAAQKALGNSAPKLTEWIGRMSRALDDCSREACRIAIGRVLIDWIADGRDVEEAQGSEDEDRVLTLPVRPLVVGGDDIIVLCHVRHALDFVQEVCQRFEELSVEHAEKARAEGVDLWPATNGQLSITAGVLFAPVTLPLAAAVPYAELLLASAKHRGREPENKQAGKPAPACVDWESCTEGLIDTPHARRQRELVFLDQDYSERVQLTQRPYTLTGLRELRALSNKYRSVPPTIRHQVLPGLRAGYWDRRVFAARLGKHHEALVSDLKEYEPPKLGGRWRRVGDKTRTTDVVDALLLMEEEARIEEARP